MPIPAGSTAPRLPLTVRRARPAADPDRVPSDRLILGSLLLGFGVPAPRIVDAGRL